MPDISRTALGSGQIERHFTLKVESSGAYLEQTERNEKDGRDGLFAQGLRLMDGSDRQWKVR